MIDFADVAVGNSLIFGKGNGLRFRHKAGVGVHVPVRVFMVADILPGPNTVKLVGDGYGINGKGSAAYGFGPLLVDLDELVLCEGVKLWNGELV